MYSVLSCVGMSVGADIRMSGKALAAEETVWRHGMRCCRENSY